MHFCGRLLAQTKNENTPRFGRNSVKVSFLQHFSAFLKVTDQTSCPLTYAVCAAGAAPACLHFLPLLLLPRPETESNSLVYYHLIFSCTSFKPRGNPPPTHTQP